MKIFHCDCGNRIFFDNTGCLNCGRLLGFAPERMDVVPLNQVSGQLVDRDGFAFVYCENHDLYGNCNWLIPADSGRTRCLSCGMNRVIPALAKAGNRVLWARVEEAKRRLLYSLLRNGLPLQSNGIGLNFQIMEDRRRNPDVLESFITTGHLHGTITINVAEADDAARHAIREQLQERYRTVLGHLRHEVGHYYFSVLVHGATLDECRGLFGDERENYAHALNRYYDNGPAVDWPQRYVSAYASAHPAEDFAETFAHVLHIDDALETAHTSGLMTPSQEVAGESWINEWVRLAITLNEVLRSLGSDDPYPFVLTDAVRRKLDFVSRLVNRPGEPGDA